MAIQCTTNLIKSHESPVFPKSDVISSRLWVNRVPLKVLPRKAWHCDCMFKMERPWRLFPPDQRYQKHQSQLKSTISDFFTWCEGVHALPQSKFGRAIDYAFSRREAMKMCCWMNVWSFQITSLNVPSRNSLSAAKTGCSPRASREPDQAELSWVTWVRPSPTVSTAANTSNTYLLNYPTFPFLANLKHCRIIYHGHRKSGQFVQDTPQ